MKILTVLTYYRPHTSGLTIYAERLARALVQKGHEVTVLTMQYDSKLPRTEILDGVRVERVPVMFRVSKGVIAPTFGLRATLHALSHDVIHLHLPQFDAAGVAARGFFLRKPTVITYHCDLKLPPGVFNAFVNRVVHVMDDIAGWCANRIVTYTEDYAVSSPYTQRFKSKVRITPPPVDLPLVEADMVSLFHAKRLSGPGPRIGMAARLASEKGVEVLLAALGRVREVFSTAQVVFAGQHENVLGEQEYSDRLRPELERYGREGAWSFLGVLSPEEMATFFPNLDVLVVPSLNSTESFGLVQIEAMMSGIPVVASDLPGVRQPVKMTGMGKIAKIGDSTDLAEAIIEVLSHREKYRGDAAEIRRRFSPLAVAAWYEDLYNEIRQTQ